MYKERVRKGGIFYRGSEWVNEFGFFDLYKEIRRGSRRDSLVSWSGHMRWRVTFGDV